MKLWIVEFYPFRYEPSIVYSIWANNEPTDAQAAKALGLDLDGKSYFMISEAEPVHISN